MNEPETFELEIEYIGSVSKTFSLPPIYAYEELATLSPLSLDVDNSGNVLSPNISIIHDEDTEHLYLETDEYQPSPRYDEGVEFDEPLDPSLYSPENSPRPLPDTITIKEDY